MCHKVFFFCFLPSALSIKKKNVKTILLISNTKTGGGQIWPVICQLLGWRVDWRGQGRKPCWGYWRSQEQNLTMPSKEKREHGKYWLVLWFLFSSFSCSVVSDSFVIPWTIACQSPLSKEFSRKTRVGCHFLLQGIFLTQVSNPCLLHWQVGSLPLNHQGSPNTQTPIKYHQFYIYWPRHNIKAEDT